MSDAPPPVEPPLDAEGFVVFERPGGGVLGARATALLVLAGVVPSGLFALAVEALGLEERLRAGWPLASEAVEVTLAALGLALFFAPLALGAWRAHRHMCRTGRCRIGRDVVLFDVPGLPTVAVPKGRLGRRTVTEHGILFQVSTAPGTRFLVPTADEAETTRAIRLLDDVGPDEAGRGLTLETGLSGGRQAALIVLATLGAVAPAYVLAFVAGARFGGIGFAVGMLGGFALEAPGLVLLGRWWRRLLIPRSVHVGHHGVVATVQGGQWFPYADLLAAGLVGEDLALETRGGTQRLLRLGPRAGEAAAIVRERLGRELTAPAWATPQERRRALATALGVHLLGFAVGLALALGDPPIHDVAGSQDLLGNHVRVVHRASDGAPEFVTLGHVAPAFVIPGLWTERVGGPGQPGQPWVDLETRRYASWPPASSSGDPVERELPPGANLLVLPGLDPRPIVSGADLPEGLAAAVDALPPGGNASLPAWLEATFPAVTDPVWRDYVEGRTSRRVHRVVDRGGVVLAWLVEEGRVGSVIVQGVAAGTVHLGFEGGYLSVRTGALSSDPATQDMLLAMGGRPGGPERLRVPCRPPTLDDLLAARDRIEAGATAREATAELLAPYWEGAPR